MIRTARAEALGISRQRLFSIRKNVGHRDYPKEETMRQHLRMAGWRLVTLEQWQNDAITR